MTHSFDIPELSKQRQRAVILEALKAGPLSTLEARERLGVQHPAGRVHELRLAGWKISTRRVSEFDAGQRLHVAALYCLEVPLHE